MSFDNFYKQLSTEFAEQGEVAPSVDEVKKVFYAQPTKFIDDSLLAEYEEKAPKDIKPADYLKSRRAEIEQEKMGAMGGLDSLTERLNYADAFRGGGITNAIEGAASAAEKFGKVMTHNVPGWDARKNALENYLAEKSGELGARAKSSDSMLKSAALRAGQLAAGAGAGAMWAGTDVLGIGPNIQTALAPGIGTGSLAKKGLERLAAGAYEASPTAGKILGGLSGAIGEGATKAPENISLLRKLSPVRLVKDVKANIVKGAEGAKAASEAPYNTMLQAMLSSANTAAEKEALKDKLMEQAVISAEGRELLKSKSISPEIAGAPEFENLGRVAKYEAKKFPQAEPQYTYEGGSKSLEGENLASIAKDLEFKSMPKDFQELISGRYKPEQGKMYEEGGLERIKEGLASKEDVLPESYSRGMIMSGGNKAKASDVSFSQNMFEHASEEGIPVDKDFDAIKYVGSWTEKMVNKYGADNVSMAMKQAMNEKKTPNIQDIFAGFKLSTLENRIKAQKALTERHQ